MLGLTLGIKETPSLLVNAEISADGGDAVAAEVGARSAQPGLIDLLERRKDFDEVVQSTAQTQLHYLGPGHGADPHNAALAIGSKAMSQFIDTLAAAPERIIYNLPSLSGQETALEAAASVGSVILVMQSGSCRRKEVAQLVAKLSQRRVRVIAAVVAEVPNNYLEERGTDKDNKRWFENLSGGWKHVTGSKNA